MSTSIKLRGEDKKEFDSFDEAVTVALYRTKDIRKASDVGELIVGNEEKGINRFINILPVSKSIFSEAWKLFLESFKKCI